MLARLRTLLEGGHDRTHDREDLRLASAVLLVEAATLDGTLDQREEETIRQILARHFSLDPVDVATLIDDARRVQGEAAGLVRHTRVIKDHFPPEERIAILEMLWEVVYADGVLHDYEANLLRRVGGLLYVSDRERGEARLRVLERLGLPH